MSTQALILAAGRGSRLGGRTEDVPKPLLQVGPKRLVEYQLEMLSAAGIGPVGMVVGYQSDEVVDVVGSQAEYVYNHKWATTNSLYSFLKARAWVDGDLVLLNCDLLLHPKILDSLLTSGGDAFVYDSGSGEGREHMKVNLADGCLGQMSKTLPEAEVHGENVGMLYFKASTVERLFGIARELIDEGRLDDWVGSAIQRLAKEVPIRAIDIAGLPWVEIDFAFDLVKARKEVLPAILKRAYTRRQFLAAVTFATILVASSLVALVLRLEAPVSEPGVDWDTLSMSGAAQVNVSNGSKSQTWFQIDPQDTASVTVTGPDTLRLESRVVLADTTAFPRPYLLHVRLGGVPYTWIAAEPIQSKSVSFQGHPVGKRVRQLVPVPAGEHTIEISMEPTTPVTCLVRVRQVSPEMDEEE